jgi:hypothetical protein
MNPKTKLKDLKYDLPGYHSFRPLRELLGCLALALFLAVIAYLGIVTVLYHANLIDSI